MTTAASPRRVLIVTNMWPRPGAELAGIFVKEQVDAIRRVAPGLDIDVMEIEGGRDRMEYVRGFRRVRRAAPAYDLIHAHYGLTAAVAAGQRRTPVVSTFHGSDVYIGWQRAISRVGLRRSRAAIFVSDRLRQRMGAGNADVVPCGVDLDSFEPMERAEARARLGLEPEARYVLFPGSPKRAAKNYPLFRAAIDALPPDVAATTRELILEDVARERVPLYLAACDAVLITSTYEGANNVAKEAIACARPVVSVEVGDVPEVAARAGGCVIAEANATALASGLMRVFSGGGILEQGPASIRAAGLDSLATARRVLAIYERVVAAVRAQRRGGASAS